jgi:tRNA A-37 threonylcarbamoyl transferase component Bud32
LLNDLKTLVDTTENLTQNPVVVADDRTLIAGRYRFLRPVGEGGMGNVYLAEDLLLARQVAVKTVRAELSGNEEVRARIKHECRMHAAIGTHANIVTLYDTIEENDRLYLVMEYFAGETLTQRLAAIGSSGLALDTALDIIRQLLQALICIHERSIVHRDIKTSNILLQFRSDGRCLVKLTDFGIARAEADEDGRTQLTSLGVQGPGTPVYMAPERIDPQRFGTICPATDLYAVGIILFELLTGTPPFKGSMTDIFTAHLMQQPDLDKLPTGLPHGLAVILNTALAKQPADRYPDAESFLTALAAVEQQRAPVSLPPLQEVAFPEATLLAMENDDAPCDATVLDTSFGRGTTLPVWQRKWFYFSAVLIVLLLFLFIYQLRDRLTLEPVPGPVSQTKMPAKAPVTTVTAVAEQKKEASVSALQAVEQVRQEKAESLPGGEHNTTDATQAQEWRVIEEKSRKIP